MPDYHKLIIALTGGMGSGKSQVARFFSALGIDVINADQIARDLTQMGTPAYQSIRNHFGPQILHPDQSIDRKRWLKKRI
jgi:dephospho-CoA kinase